MPHAAPCRLVVALTLALAACDRAEPRPDTANTLQRDLAAATATSATASQPAPASPPAATGGAAGDVVPTGGAATSTGAPQNYAVAGAGGRLEITGTENQYDIILPADVLFDFDKAVIRPDATPLLDQVRQHLTTHPADQVHVRGHTDSEGSEQYNALLSQRRAKAVADWLKANVRVRGLVMALGLGEREPLVPNQKPDGSDDPVGRQRNRRVTLSVVAYPDANAMLGEARRRAARP